MPETRPLTPVKGGEAAAAPFTLDRGVSTGKKASGDGAGTIREGSISRNLPNRVGYMASGAGGGLLQAGEGSRSGNLPFEARFSILEADTVSTDINPGGLAFTTSHAITDTAWLASSWPPETSHRPRVHRCAKPRRT